MWRPGRGYWARNGRYTLRAMRGSAAVRFHRVWRHDGAAEAVGMIEGMKMLLIVSTEKLSEPIREHYQWVDLPQVEGR